jgi:hypothetical protein
MGIGNRRRRRQKGSATRLLTRINVDKEGEMLGLHGELIQLDFNCLQAINRGRG